jgi:hypothetical protein
VIDDWAGWKPTANLGANTRRLETVEVKSGEIVGLTIRRDLAAITQMHPETDGLSYFHWRGRDYSLSPAQARVVQRLLAALAAGKPDVSETELMAAAQSTADAPLSYIFNDGKHPAWGTLVLAMDGERPTYRLAPLQPEANQEGAHRGIPPDELIYPAERIDSAAFEAAADATNPVNHPVAP